MLKGINVLNTYTVTNETWASALFIGIILALVTAACISIAGWAARTRRSLQDNACVFLIVLVISLFTMVGCIYCFTHLPEDRLQTMYQVTVDDTVSTNEFNSKYEVVKQEGKLYTIIEKND